MQVLMTSGVKATGWRKPALDPMPSQREHLASMDLMPEPAYVTHWSAVTASSLCAGSDAMPERGRDGYVQWLCCRPHPNLGRVEDADRSLAPACPTHAVLVHRRI